MNDITFDGIKTSIIEYLSKQNEFKDYNWSASGINILVDALAYMAHYMTTYSNFSINEIFLDTAQLRSSVVSLAKNIGYIPHQYTSAQAKLKLTYIGKDNIDGFIIPKGTTFTATQESNNLYFRTTDAVEVVKTDTGRYYAEVNVKEGIPTSQTWIHDGNTQYVIFNNIDTQSLKVVVYGSASDSSGYEYQLLTDISDFGPEARLYLIEENTAGNVQLKFGDNIISKSLVIGNIVKVTYDVSNGSLGNNVVSFMLNNLNGQSSIKDWKVETLSMSSGGSDRETVEEVRYAAPLFFKRQGRNVVAEDYKAHILSEYSGLIDSIHVWGGENNDPPVYGTVFVCAKPKNLLSLTTQQKNDIRNTLTKNSVIGIQIKFTDPQIMYATIKNDLKFNNLYSSKTVAQLKADVLKVTEDYFKNQLSDFDVQFINSKYTSNIYKLDENILNVITDIELKQYIVPMLNTDFTYTVDFKNKLKETSVYIGPFFDITNGTEFYMKDDGTGNLLLYNSLTGSSVQQGSVDYNTGIITINQYNFKGEYGTTIPILCVPNTNIVEVSKNYVFSLNSVNTLINGK